MRTRRLPTGAALVALAALAGLTTTGCATASEAGAADNAAFVVVDNSTATLTQATIYAIPDGGVRKRLGTVGLQDQERFAIQDVIPGGEYRLQANIGTDVVTSRSFTLGRGDTVQWDLKTNSIFYGADRGGLQRVR